MQDLIDQVQYKIQVVYNKEINGMKYDNRQGKQSGKPGKGNKDYKSKARKEG